MDQTPPSPPRAKPVGLWTEPQTVRMVRIRLGDEKVAPQPDPLGRPRVGYAPGLSPADLWERARGVWKAKLTTLANTALAVVVYDDTVVGVATVDAVRPIEDRVAIEGRPVVGHPLIGQRDPLHNTSRNPIAYGSVVTVLPVSTPPRQIESVLKDAIAVLTEAGRLRRPIFRPDDAPTDGSLRGVRGEVEPQRAEQADWAEFVTLALAGAAANLGGIEEALAGRPGSWEAGGVRSLLESAAGADEHALWQYRTEPLNITVFVEDLVDERTALWKGYAEAEAEIQRMIRDAEAANPEIDPTPYVWLYQRTVDGAGPGPWEPVDPDAPAWSLEAWLAANTFPSEDSERYWTRMVLGDEPEFAVSELHLPRTPELGAEYDRLEAERDTRLSVVYALEERLEDQRAREVSAYGEALVEHVGEAALALPGLDVPVHVNADLTSPSGPMRLDQVPSVVEHLIERAVMETPSPEDLPGTPLSRLLQAGS